MRRTLAHLVVGVLLAGAPSGLPAAGAHGPTAPRYQPGVPGPVTWQVISKGGVDSGTWAMQVARTSDGLYVPITMKDPSTAVRFSHEALITTKGNYLGDRVIDPTGCTTDHALVGLGLKSHDLLAVAGGLPLAGCTSDELVQLSTIGPTQPFGTQVNWVQWGNHAYNAGGENLALLQHPSGVLLTAYAAPEGMVIGHSGASYGPGNPTPVLDNCCDVNFPNLALDAATGNVWASWWKQGPGEPQPTVRVRRLDPATGTALGDPIDLRAPKAQAKKFQTSAATQRTALSGLPGRPGVYAAFLGRGKRDIDYPTVWIQGLDSAGCECPGGSKPKRVFGSYASTDVYHEVTVAAGAHSFWVLAAVYVGDPGEYAYVARHWTPQQSWGPPIRMEFPKGLTNGIFDAPTSLMADAQRADGGVDVITQPSLEADAIYHRILEPVEPDAHWSASGTTYKIRLPKDVYVQPKTTGKLRLNKNGASSTVYVDVNAAGKATVHLEGDVKLVSLKIKTGDFTTTYDL